MYISNERDLNDKFEATMLATIGHLTEYFLKYMALEPVLKVQSHERAEVTRLLPDAVGTTCGERLEKVFGAEHSHIGRVPFRTEKFVNGSRDLKFGHTWKVTESFLSTILHLTRMNGCRISEPRYLSGILLVTSSFCSLNLCPVETRSYPEVPNFFLDLNGYASISHIHFYITHACK